MPRSNITPIYPELHFPLFMPVMGGDAYNGRGYYFRDADDDMVGPYEMMTDCIRAGVKAKLAFVNKVPEWQSFVMNNGWFWWGNDKKVGVVLKGPFSAKSPCELSLQEYRK